MQLWRKDSSVYLKERDYDIPGEGKGVRLPGSKRFKGSSLVEFVTFRTRDMKVYGHGSWFPSSVSWARLLCSVICPFLHGYHWVGCMAQKGDTLIRGYWEDSVGVALSSACLSLWNAGSLPWVPTPVRKAFLPTWYPLSPVPAQCNWGLMSLQSRRMGLHIQDGFRPSVQQCERICRFRHPEQGFLSQATVLKARFCLKRIA